MTEPYFKTYYFETKSQRISSASYLRELLYSMFTTLQPATKIPYVPHPTPKFNNVSPRNHVCYQILLTWQEFHEKLLQSLNEENISSWTLEELSIWWAIIKFLHMCLMEFASKNGWGSYFKYQENPENLLKQYRLCENLFKSDLYYANSVHLSYNELFGDCIPFDLEKVKLPVIEGKVLLNSLNDFYLLFGIERNFLFDKKGTKLSQENREKVVILRKLIGTVQLYVKQLTSLLQSHR